MCYGRSSLMASIQYTPTSFSIGVRLAVERNGLLFLLWQGLDNHLKEIEIVQEILGRCFGLHIV